MENNKYSFLISVYKKEHPEFLKVALDSMVNQTLKPSEIVLICDGPLTEDLNHIIDDYNKKYPNVFNIIRLENNVGLGVALSVGVNHCSNELIARMDSDDYSDPNRMKVTIEYLTENPDTDLVGTNCVEFEEDIDNPISLREMPISHEEIVKYSKTRNPYVHPSVTFKKTKLLEAGNYRHYLWIEDYDMWVRMILVGAKCANIPQTLTYMRINDDFYRRRGGFKYMRAILKFKKEMYRIKYITFRQYLKTSFATIVMSFLPNFIRKRMYKKVLRKS